MTTVALTPREHAALSEVADMIYPSWRGLPAASEAQVVERHVPAVLRACPELAVPFAAVLAQMSADERPRDLQMQALSADDFEALLAVIAAAYYLAPDVQAAIGYSGQQALQPLANRDAVYQSDGTLASVVARGRIYRPIEERYG